MMMAHDLRISVPRVPRETRRVVEDLVSASKARARRRWVIRSVSLLGVTSVILCALLVWRRNEAARTSVHRDLVPAVAALQERIDSLGILPATPPPSDAASPAPSLPPLDVLPKVFEGYAPQDPVQRQFAMNASDPVIIAWSRPIHLFLQADGRWVVLYANKRVSSTWMTNRAFRTAQLDHMRRLVEFEKERSRRPVELP
jgi:hypothetical protein